MQISGVAAIVTGGGSGLGAGTARMLAAAGARVTVVDLRKDAAEAVAAEVGGLGIGADVTSAEQGRPRSRPGASVMAPPASSSTVPASHRPSASSGATARWSSTPSAG